MISGTGRYALRILGFLAARNGEFVQASQIAEATGIPPNYLSKILTLLSKHGIVDSQKGWGGGFSLSPRSTARPIADVVALFDGPFRQGECVFGLPRCDEADPCPIHCQWETVRSGYEQMLQTVLIRDLRSR
jgi:Rrf2 family protein